MAPGNAGGGQGGDGAVPAPPAGFAEEPEAAPAAPAAPPPPNPQAQALLAETAQELNEAGAQLASEQTRTTEVKNAEERWIPGDRALDRSWEGSLNKGQAELPAEEANRTDKTAATLVEAVDADRQAVDAEVGRAPATPQAQSEEAQIDALDTDAINEGLAVTQDAINAQAAFKQKDPVDAQAAEDAAQRDMGQVAHDLAEADAIRGEVEGKPVGDRTGLPPDPA